MKKKMEKLNLVLILLLSFFVLHLYLTQNSQQDPGAHQLYEHTKSPPLSPSPKMVPGRLGTKNIHYLNYSKNGSGEIINHTLSEFHFVPIYALIPLDNNTELIFGQNSSFKHLDYQIPTTLPRNRVDGVQYQGALYLVTPPNLCQNPDNNDLYIFPKQHLPVLPGYNDKTFKYSKEGSLLVNQSNLKASVYKD